jgi:hypothetical protein
MRSPTARTLKLFRDNGATARIVEQWVGFGRGSAKRPGVRRDLWGADILVRQGARLLAIQSTTGGNHSRRVEKSLENDELHNWLDCGVAFFVYSWSKKGPRGKRKLWAPRVTQLIEAGDKIRVL